jgi:hypothetical protein
MAARNGGDIDVSDGHRDPDSIPGFIVKEDRVPV